MDVSVSYQCQLSASGLSSVPVTDRGNEEVNGSFSDFGTQIVCQLTDFISQYLDCYFTKNFFIMALYFKV